MDILFDGPYGVYHSVYDDYGWMSRHGDPGFRYHAAMARLAGVIALRFANADVLPFDPAALRPRDRRLRGGAGGGAGGPAARRGPRAPLRRGRPMGGRGEGDPGRHRRRARVGSGGRGADSRGERVAARSRACGLRSRRAARAALVPAPDLRSPAVVRRRDAPGDPRSGGAGDAAAARAEIARLERSCERAAEEARKRGIGARSRPACRAERRWRQPDSEPGSATGFLAATRSRAAWTSGCWNPRSSAIRRAS